MNNAILNQEGLTTAEDDEQEDNEEVGIAYLFIRGRGGCWRNVT